MVLLKIFLLAILTLSTLSIQAQDGICDIKNLLINECKYIGGLDCSLAARNLMGCEGDGERLLALLFAVKACFDEESSGCNLAGLIMMREKKYEQAERYFNKAVSVKGIDNFKRSDALFNLACVFSLRKEAKKSADYLEKAINENKGLVEMIDKEEYLEFLKGTDEYKKLWSRIKPPAKKP